MAAFSFELGKCVHPEVRERTLANLANVDPELCGRVASGTRPTTPAPRRRLGGPVPVDRTVLTTRSMEYDALAAALAVDPYTAVNLGEAFRHHKVIAAWGEGQLVLDVCGITADLPGVVVGDAGDGGFAARLVESMGWHRHWTACPSPERDDLRALSGTGLQLGPGGRGPGPAAVLAKRP